MDIAADQSDAAGQGRSAREAKAPMGRAGVKAPAEKAAFPAITLMMLIVTVLPVSFYMGGVLLNPSRLLLMVLIFPALIRWASGKVGKPILPDYMFLGFGVWMLISLALNQGIGRTGVYWGSQFVEVVGAYFVGRAFIISRACFMFMVRAYLILILFLLPIGIYENLTGEVIYLNLLDSLPGLDAPGSVNYGPRMGLHRAQVAFHHPILYGVVVSTAFSFAWLVLKAKGRGTGSRVISSAIVTVATISSMSAGAIVSVATQIMLIAWDWILRANAARWKIFFGILAFFYVVIDLVSNRSPFAAVLSRLTFSNSTAYNRIRIWDFGSAEVMRHPIFGMGLFSDWIRPFFMSDSIDNHWLLMAMRFGLPGIFLLLGPFIWIIYKISRKQFANEQSYLLGRAVVFSMSGAIIALCTVAAFASTFSMILFLLGGAVFLLYEPSSTAPALQPVKPGRRSGRARQGSESAEAAGAGAGRKAGTGRTGRKRRSGAKALQGESPAENLAESGIEETGAEADPRARRYSRFPDKPGRR